MNTMRKTTLKHLLLSMPATVMLFAMLVFASCNQAPSGPGDGGDGGGGENPDTTDTTGNGGGDHDITCNFSQQYSGDIFVAPCGDDVIGDGSLEKPFASPSRADSTAKDGDVISILPGTYEHENAKLAVTGKNLTFQGVGNERPHMKLAPEDEDTWGKGVWVVTFKASGTTTIDNIELSGSEVPDNNGSGIRVSADYSGDLFIRNSFIHDNQMGILSSMPEGASITVENNEFARNGGGGGYTHNSYFDGNGTLTFRYNYTHDVKVGNLVKTRNKVNYIEYNKIIGGSKSGYNGSYQVDIPDGGIAYVIGNVIVQGSSPENYRLLEYGKENFGKHADNRLYVINNTFVNNANKGSFLFLRNDQSIKVVSRNNIFTGPGNLVKGNTDLTSDHNFQGDPGYADAANYDFHLTSEFSPGVDGGTDPGSSESGYDLTPQKEYIEVADSKDREEAGEIDLGAFEFGEGAAPPASGISEMYDFDDNSKQGWTFDDPDFAISSDKSYSGDYSIGVDRDGKRELEAHITPSVLHDQGGVKLDSLTFKYYQKREDTGVGLRLLSYGGQVVVGAAVAIDHAYNTVGDEDISHYPDRPSGGYYGTEIWIKVDIAFNWDQHTADVMFTNTNNDQSHTYNIDLGPGNNVNRLDIAHYGTHFLGFDAGDPQGRTAMHARFDDIGFWYTPK